MDSEKLNLFTPISRIYLIGPTYARRLSKLGIRTVSDLLYHLPSRYEDFSVKSNIASLQEGEIVTVQGKVVSLKNQYTRRGFALQVAEIADETGKLEVLWFNQRFLTRTISAGNRISLSGKIIRDGHKLHLESPVYEILPVLLPGKSAQQAEDTIHTGRLVPIYPETYGITSKWIRNRINHLLKAISSKQIALKDYLDDNIREKYQVIPLEQAVFQVHFPQNLEQAGKARERLAFDELLISQLEAKQRKEEWQQKTVGNKFKIVEVSSKLKLVVSGLPFTLTGAQKRVINEIYRDLARETPMNRLLQGDVGSGKTVVAALAMLAAYLNGFQAVLMAPTEILAEQHFKTLQELLSPLGIGVGIATGSRKDYTGYDVVVGTHALLSDKLNFNKLGLVVIDEQHRFGVEQRAKLTAKGLNPHVLTMTATPIPRTIALTLYGDLDISVLDEMPKNRQRVKTWLVPPEKRMAAYQWIKKQNTQTFIICPLIEESEAETLLTVKSAKAEYEKLRKEIFPDLKLGLLHGRMRPKEKERILTEFRRGELDILVATPVVEVGIDIPQANIMLIEGADRFGLAQLHQLRGRVGRGTEQAYCLLFSQNESPWTAKRLKNLETIHDGLELAEMDLKFRGPGERYGLAQHGKWGLKIASFDNLSLVERADKLAKEVIARPEAFPLLRKTLMEATIGVAPN